MFDPYKVTIKKIHTSYRIIYDGGKYILKTPQCTIPFGIEEYKKGLIVNLEFKDDAENNDIYNFITQVHNIDTIFSEELGTPIVSSMKKRNNKTVHMRIHVKKDFQITSYELKNKNVIVELELDRIWNHNESYGLIWYMKDIQII